MHPETRSRPLRRVLVAVAGLALTAAATPAAAAVQPQGEHRASAVGTVVHAEAIEQPELSEPTSVRLVDADAAFSAAAHDATGLPEQQTTEFGGLLQPTATADGTQVAGADAYGRGFGLDVSLGQEGQQDGQLTLAGLSEAVAPPSSELVVNEVGPVEADPLAYATTLRGEAQALYGDGDVCSTLGDRISYGRGLVADLQLVDQDGTPDADGEAGTLEQPFLSASAEDPDRAVSSSLSHTFLAPQVAADGTVVGPDLGIVAETRQTIAPVTLFAGTDDAVTVELLGEWVLRAVATGVPGSAHVQYGPGDASPETSVLRIVQADSTETLLTTQDLFGDEGLVIDASPLVSIAIGEDPRAIGGDATSAPVVAEDGTAASAAVDVVRIRIASEEETGEVTEIRLGHMEVSAEVPEGGIACDLPVTKSSDEVELAPGDTFTYTITVDNPFRCELTDVRITDRLSASDGVTWTVDGATPEPSSLTDTEVVWEGLGPIAPGESLSVDVTVTVGADSTDGAFRDEAVATAACDGGPVDAEAGVTTAVALDTTAIDMGGSDILEEPGVVVPSVTVEEPVDRPLAATGGGAATALLGLGAAALAVAIRRRG